MQKNNNVGETTCSSNKELVTCIFNKLQTARHYNFTWIPNIILNIPTPPCVSSLLPLSITANNTTDIVPLIQHPSAQLVTILKHQLNYPKDCYFYLEGYNGMTYSERLASNVITSATKKTGHI